MSDDGRNRQGGDGDDGRSGEDFNLFTGEGEEAAGADAAPGPRRGRRRRGGAGEGNADADAAQDGDGASDPPKPSGETLPVRRGRRRNKKGSALPALRPADAGTPAIRAERVDAIRRDLVRRRRRKGLGVVARLLVFVLLPTVTVAWFLWSKASDLYRTESVFVVQSAETGGRSTAGGGGLFAALGAGVTDSIAVQNFILSREVLRRLDEDLGLIAHYQDPSLDWFHRLDANASFEEAYEHYLRFTEVTFDPTEGVLSLGVVASDPVYAQQLSTAIIGYAEGMVDTLSDPIRVAAFADSELYLEQAENRLREAQLRASELRKELETFSVEGEFAAEMNIITQMELELERLRARLTNLRRVTGEDDPRVQRLRAEVETLEGQVAARKSGVTGAGTQAGRSSLADVNAQLELANFEVTTAMRLFQAAIEAREFARTESQRQHRYLSLVVAPTVPDSANFPKKAEMTALAFLIFLGIYIMSSLTISLIREQASI